jgi:hypothetical protein
MQDQLGRSSTLRPSSFSRIALLARRQGVVEDHRRRVQFVGDDSDFLHLAAAGIKPGVRPLAPAAHHAVALGPRAVREARDLGDAFLVFVVAEIQANEDGGGRVGGPAGDCGGSVEQKRT